MPNPASIPASIPFTNAAQRTVVRLAARDLRAGDQYLTPGGQLREIAKVWHSRGAHLFAGSRARVEIVEAYLVDGGGAPKAWYLDDMLTVARLVDEDTEPTAEANTILPQERTCVVCGDPVTEDAYYGAYVHARAVHGETAPDHRAQPTLTHPMDNDPFAGLE